MRKFASSNQDDSFLLALGTSIIFGIFRHRDRKGGIKREDETFTHLRTNLCTFTKEGGNYVFFNSPEINNKV